MKIIMKFVFISVIVLSTESLFAQTNTFPSSGNVGVGTTSPESKLHIQNSNVGIKTTYSDALIEDVDAHLDIVSNSDASWGSAINFVEGNGSSNIDVWSIARQTTNGNGDSSLRFNFGTNNQHNNANKLTLLTSGNIGIGTTSPDEKLTVAGTVKSLEVIVEEDTGADFVFEEDYDLPDLSELEAFIKSNKHLPEIPTAEQMKAEGVKVGELQIKLLQKIEELTLYIIQQQKKKRELEKHLAEEKELNRIQEQTLNVQQKLIEAQSKSNKVLQIRLDQIEKLLNKSSEK